MSDTVTILVQDSTGATASATFTLPLIVVVATPTFSPAAGTYTTIQTVSISCTTPNSTIYFTTDGSTPTTNSSVYVSPLVVQVSETINALATAPGAVQSTVGSAAYVINLPVAATPTFSPIGGTYSSAQNISLNCSTIGSTIYYTVDGSTPTTASNNYVSPIPIDSNITINAMATAYNYTQSGVGTASYVINITTVATPTFAPAAGSYVGTQNVTISTTTPGSTIYYTTDGSTPSVPVSSNVLTQQSINGIAGNLWVHGGTPGGNPPNNQLGLISEQANPQTGNGSFQANGWNAGAFTGFTPNTPATAQLGFAATGKTSTAQAEGTTMGAYLQSIDLPGCTTLSTCKQMITPQIGFANKVIWSSTSNVLAGLMNLQIPTATGSDIYCNINHQFVGPGSTGFTINVMIFHQGAAAPSAPLVSQDVGATNTYIVNVPIGVSGSNPYMTSVSGQYSPNPIVGFKPFSWSFSYAQFAQALQLAQAKYPSIPSIVPSDWTMTQMHLNAEFHYVSGSADCTLGWSMQNWDVTLSQGVNTSILYTAPVAVAASETLKAIANASGLTQSAVGSAAYTISASSLTPVFNFTSFAGQAGSFGLPSSAVSGTQMLVGVNSGHSSGAAWYRTQQPVGPFTTTFTIQNTGLTTPGHTTAGVTFCVQNGTAPPGTAGFVGINGVGDANCCGYGAYDPAQLGTSQNPNFIPSVGVKFDCGWNSEIKAPATGAPNSTGLYIAGGPYAGLFPSNDLNPYGINLYTTNPMFVTIVYDGTILVMTILDTITNAQGRYEWPLNLSACMAGETLAYVGFTEGKVTTANQFVNSWAYSRGFNPRVAQPTFTPPAGQYSVGQSVVVSGASGASLFYTTNGLLPTSSSTPVSGSIQINANTNLQVVAIQPGFSDSLVAKASYKIGTSNTINLPSFAAGDGMILCGYATRAGSTIQLGDTLSQIQGEVSNVWWGAPVTVSAPWSTTFTLQFVNTTGSPTGNGVTFIVAGAVAPAANTPSWAALNGSPTLIGGEIQSLGYGGTHGSGAGSRGILNSLAVKFDISGGNTTGVYTNGTTPGSNGGTPITGVTLASGNPITCALNYTGTTLSMTLTDTVTHGAFSTAFNIDIAATIGATQGYVGFGATSTWLDGIANITLNNWSGF